VDEKEASLQLKRWVIEHQLAKSARVLVADRSPTWNPCNKILLLGKPTVAKLVRKFHTFYIH
jgi:hypothetical protein